MLNKGYFQITVASRHEIVKNQMEEIADVLRMDKLYFVVPHMIYGDFKKQRLVKGTKSKKITGTSIIDKMFEMRVSREIDNII